MAGKNVVDIVLEFESKGSSYIKQIIKDIAKITSAMKEAEKASDNMADGMTSDGKKIKSSFKSTDASVEKLTSSIEQMTREMKEYRASVTSVNSINKKASDSFGKLGGAIALAFGGAAVAGSISQTNEDILLLSNRAKLLEMEMSELAAMQKVAFNNGNVAEFEEGLKNLSQRIYDLRKNGSGEGMEVFQQLKLDLDAIYAMPIEEQFYAIADAMADAGYSVQDMYGAFDQLGSDQLGDLAYLLENGSAHMRKLVEETKNADTALSELDYKRLEYLAKATKEVEQNLDNTSKKITSDVAPALLGVQGGFNEILKVMNESGGALDWIWQRMLDFGGVVVQVGERAGSSFSTVFSSLKMLYLEANILMNELSVSLHESYASFFDTLYEKIWWLKKETLDMFGTFSDSAQKAADEMGDVYNGGDERTIQISTDKKQIEEYKKALAKEQEEFNKSAQKVAEPIDFTKSSRAYVAHKETIDKLAESEVNLAEAKAKVEKQEGKSGTRNNSLELLEAEIAAEELVLEAKLKANQAKIDADLEAERERYEIAKVSADNRANLEELSADEALALKLEADKEYADNAAKLLQQKLDLEIELEKKKISNLQKLQDKAASDTEKAAYGGEIDSSEVELNALIKERNAITSETLQLSELDKARLEAAVALEKHRTAQKKAQKTQTEESKEALEKETKELEKQKEIRDRMQDVYSSYLVATGRETEDALNAIDKKYRWLLDNLEQGSEDLALVEKLINIEKAEAQIEELNRKLQDVSYSYENGDISKSEYENQSMNILGEMNDIAQASNSVALMNDVTKATRDAANAFDELYQVGEMVGSSLSSSFTSAFSSIIDGSKSAEDAFRDMILNMTQQIIDMMINQMVQNFLSSMFSGMGGGGAGGGISSGIASSFGSASISAVQRHDGGFASKYGGVTRQLDPSMFFSGGGLNQNEVLAVLERDEQVLTKEQQRQREQQAQGAAASSISIVNTLDDASIAGAMDSPQGNKVIENKVRAMKNEIKTY